MSEDRTSYTEWLERCERLVASRFLPDAAVRLAVRVALRRRLRWLERERLATCDQLPTVGPIAVETETANRQHYELPTEFFRVVLGPRLKYSSALWSAEVKTLSEAEDAMLELTAARAALADGQRILDLGCGWGAFSLWAAKRYPTAKITALTNSRTQEVYVRDRAGTHGLSNLDVRRGNAASLKLDGRFDRIVSIEMLEHVRNVRPLLNQLVAVLERDGQMFVHVFSHRRYAYTFEPQDGWMARWFFSGGVMPDLDHFSRNTQAFRTTERWILNGEHYARTLQAWLRNLDVNRNLALCALREFYGAANAELWLARWRLFFIACAELFAFRRGDEWVVAHHVLVPAE